MSRRVFTPPNMLSARRVFTPPNMSSARPTFSPPALTEEEMLCRDALRWRALMACSRITIESTTPPRTALYEARNPDQGEYLCVAFWTNSMLPTSHMAVPVIEAFADMLIDVLSEET